MKIDGQQIIKLRKNEELTQSELAELSGLSERTVIRAEKGEVSHESLLSIAAALRIDHKLLIQAPSNESTQNEEGNTPDSVRPKSSEASYIEPSLITDDNSTESLVEQYLNLVRPDHMPLPLPISALDISFEGGDTPQEHKFQPYELDDALPTAISPTMNAPRNNMEKYRHHIQNWFDKLDQGDIRFEREKPVLKSLIRSMIVYIWCPILLIAASFFLSAPSQLLNPSKLPDSMWLTYCAAIIIYSILVMRNSMWRYRVYLPAKVELEFLYRLFDRRQQIEAPEILAEYHNSEFDHAIKQLRKKSAKDVNEKLVREIKEEVSKNEKVYKLYLHASANETEKFTNAKKIIQNHYHRLMKWFAFYEKKDRSSIPSENYDPIMVKDISSVDLENDSMKRLLSAPLYPLAAIILIFLTFKGVQLIPSDPIKILLMGLINLFSFYSIFIVLSVIATMIKRVMLGQKLIRHVSYTLTSKMCNGSSIILHRDRNLLYKNDDPPNHILQKKTLIERLADKNL